MNMWMSKLKDMLRFPCGEWRLFFILFAAAFGA